MSRLYRPHGTALALTQGTTAKITVPNPITYGAGLTITQVMWIRRNGGGLATSQGSSKGSNDILVRNASTLYVHIDRATTGADSTVALASYFQGSWDHFAWTYNESDGIRIYQGSLTGPTIEVTYSSARTVGSGNTSADTGDLYIGNRGVSNTLNPGMDCAMWSIYDRVVSLGEINAMKFAPVLDQSTKLLLFPGIDPSLNLAVDYSGYARHGVPTSPTLVPGVPLRMPQRLSRRTEWLSAKTITASSAKPWLYRPHTRTLGAGFSRGAV
jgi:hypothetical protein